MWHFYFCMLLIYSKTGEDWRPVEQTGKGQGEREGAHLGKLTSGNFLSQKHFQDTIIFNLRTILH